jgi:hypothetical protein
MDTTSFSLLISNVITPFTKMAGFWLLPLPFDVSDAGW